MTHSLQIGTQKFPVPCAVRNFPRVAAMALLLALGTLSTAATAAWDLQNLMQNLSQAKPGRATFVEKKFIAVLDRPVESSGELLYLPPDRLEKRTLKPRPESMVISGSELVVERGRQKHRLQLQSYPELTVFIDSIRGTLAGDLKTLERSYQVSLEGRETQWMLLLVPLDEKMKAVVQRIRIAGAADEVRSVEIFQADGDRSMMTIEKVPGP
jgi:outer membrane lipoprotein-sorting protein